jgi:D-alanyl-D-alanine carboxypeptidase/D-alanyl-D-alanine-endopeptidase (penicillin-binding protein 4)
MLSMFRSRTFTTVHARRLTRLLVLGGSLALSTLAQPARAEHSARLSDSAASDHLAIVRTSAGVSAPAISSAAPQTRQSGPTKKAAAARRATASKKAVAARRSRSATTTAARKRRGTRSRAVRRAPPALIPTAPRGPLALEQDLATLLNARTKTGRWGALVVSLTRGDTLFAQGAGDAVTPASTMKLFTAALALERLGPDHTFSTDLLRDGVVSPDGTLRGNLYVRGDGDPGLSDRFIRGGAGAPVDVLAGMLVATGVRRIAGDVVGDASAFESRRIPSGWSASNLGSYYAAPFSALSLNENLLLVSVAPGRSGQRATVGIEPASRGVQLTGSVRTVRGSRSRVVIRRVSDRQIAVSGTIGAASGSRRWSAVMDDPARFTAGALVAALERAGVTVDGDVRTGAAPSTATPITGLPSPRVAQLVSVMNRESVNHYAELLYRNAARGPQRQGIGSADAAFDQLQRFLRDRVRGDAGGVFATDGSGLSTLDRVTPRAMVQLLRYANDAPWSAAFHASLPVAGESDLLRHRMRLTAAQGNLHAKTGTLNDVVGLAGYVRAVNGELLAFSLVYNGRELWGARESIDAMGATMAAWQR